MCPWQSLYRWKFVSFNCFHPFCLSQWLLLGTSYLCAQTFREELMPILLKLFKNLQRKKHFQTHSMRPSLLWYQNQRQPQKRKLQANIIDHHRCKNPQPKFSKQISATHHKAHTPWSSWVYSRNVRILQHTQINQCYTPY